MVRDLEEAEELTQEAFVKAFVIFSVLGKRRGFTPGCVGLQLICPADF